MSGLSSGIEISASLSNSQIEDLRLASSQLTGAKRRVFQAEMTLKYCNGSARQAESRFSWSRQTTAVGIAEKRTGIICCGAQAGFGGNKRWEEKQPEAAAALSHSTYLHRTVCSTPAMLGRPRQRTFKFLSPNLRKTRSSMLSYAVHK